MLKFFRQEHLIASAIELIHPASRIKSLSFKSLKPMNEAPIPPAPNECCESGCDPCVWDIYYEALRKWQEQQNAKHETKQPTDNQ